MRVLAIAAATSLTAASLVSPAVVLALGAAPAAAASTSVTAVADAFVTSRSPYSNNGSTSSLWVDGSPEITSFLRFPELPGDAKHQVTEPTLDAIAEGLTTHGLAGEAALWHAVRNGRF